MMRPTAVVVVLLIVACAAQVYEHHVWTGTTLAVRVATLRNITWHGGTLDFANTTDVDITIDNCTMTNMVSVLAGSGGGANVAIRVFRSKIESFSGNVFAFGGTSNAAVSNFTVHMEESTLRGGRGVAALLPEHSTGEVVMTDIRLTSINCTVIADWGGSTWGVAAVGVASHNGSPIRINGLELVSVNSAVTAISPSTNFVAALGVIARGVVTADHTAFKLVGTQVASHGNVYATSAGFSIEGDLTGRNMIIEILTSTVVAVGNSRSIVSAGWLADNGNLVAENTIATAVNSSIVASSPTSNVVSMAWWSWGNINVRNATAAAVHSNVRASGSDRILAMAAGSFTNAATQRSTSVNGLSLSCCNVTLFSSENALMAVTRFGKRIQLLGNPGATSLRYVISKTSVFTERELPFGDCLGSPPSASAPSVVADTTLQCGGDSGPGKRGSGQLFMINSGPTTRFPGANTTFAPDLDCGMTTLRVDIVNATAAMPAPKGIAPGSVQLTVLMSQLSADAVAATAMVSTVVTAIVNPAAAAQVVRVSATIRVLECALVSDDEAPSFMEMPLQVPIGGGNLPSYAGALLLTTLLLVLLPFAVHALVWHRDMPDVWLCGAVHAVSVQYFVPNCAAAIALLLIHSSGGIEVGIAVTSAIGIGAVIGMTTWRLVYFAESDTVAMHAFVDGCASTDNLKQRLYPVEELAVSTFVAAITGSRSRSCEAIAIVVVCAIALHIAYLFLIKPYRTKLDSGLALIGGVLQLCLAVLVTVARAEEEGPSPALKTALARLLVALFSFLMIHAVVMLMQKGVEVQTRNTEEKKGGSDPSNETK